MADRHLRPRQTIQGRRHAAPLIVMALLTAGFGLSLLFQDQSPDITQITPRVGNPGDVMVIDGSYFGHDRNRGSVSIAGVRVSASSILEWSPQRISFRIPDEAKSGAVVVQTPAGRGKFQAFTSLNQIPKVVQPLPGTAAAVIQGASPVFCWPGDPVELRGRNFGHRQGASGVQVDGRMLEPADVLQWSDSSILIRMPSYALQGQVRVVDAQGQSNILTVPIQRGPVRISAGTAKRTWKVGILYDIGDLELSAAPAWGTVEAYMPLPPACAEQSLEDLSSSGAPVQRSSSLVFRLDNPLPDLSYHLTADYRVVRSSLRLEQSGPDPETGYDGYAAYLERWAQPSALVPSGDPAVKAWVKTVVKGETRPLARARLLYRAVIDRLEPQPGPGIAFAPQVLGDRRANSFGYANLLVAALRAAGIPAQLIEGLVVGTDGKAESRLWAEFFIPTVGWLQADPAAGDGLSGGSAEGAAEWWFGNIDDKHIILVRGETATGLARNDAAAQKQFQQFVLLQSHAWSQGNVESFGLFIAVPTVKPGS